MFKKLKAYYMENIEAIAASMAALNGGDYRPFIER